MNETKRKIALLLTMVAVLIWGYFNYPWESPAKHQANSREIAEQARPAEATVALQPDGSSANDRENPTSALPVDPTSVRVKKWSHDPFYRPQKYRRRSESASQPVFKVKAIIDDPHSPSAYVNGQTVRPGDIVSGATVVKIDRNLVTFKWGDKTIRVGPKRG